ATGKPGVVHFIGGLSKQLSDRLETTATLADAAHAALTRADIEIGHTAGLSDSSASVGLSSQGVTATGASAIAGARIVGLYCGGTLCQEAWNILHQAGFDVRSNVAGKSAKKIHPDERETGHVVWDLGDDAFTVGKPHPMIEPSLRDSRVAQAGKDPTVGVILADCVIGYGAHENPAASLAEAANQASKSARESNRMPAILVASVTGTDEDPQNLHRQREILEAAGVIVAPSNAAAARWVVDWMKGKAS
ncbi:FdrA family protein, partial [Candidatus Bipolaricaulota bacterium]|nr:FdrA family protein [Candidatus Bipolaricaulota bacterium]